MTLEIVPGESTKPAASSALVKALEGVPSLAGLLFIGFPIIRTADGPQAVDALWISEEKGIVIFDLVQGDDLGDYQDRQDVAFNAIVSRLRLDRRLVARRELQIPVNTVSFAPQFVDAKEDGYTIIGSTNIANKLSELDSWRDSCVDIYKAALSTLQNVTTIRTGRGRTPSAPRAATLKDLEENIATLDPWQNRALLARINGVQRIRGLAGSGKTIVLALKAAYLHILHPEWRIAITFNTRSLKDTFRMLVRDFYTREAEQEPDWSCLEVMNAWGAHHDGDGIYSAFCKRNGIDYFDFDSARQRSRAEPFAAACQKALADATGIKPVYDAILVDEAQDLPPDFLRLCYAFLNEPKRLIYAYDELQRLSGESLPPPETLFGKRKSGRPRVRLEPEHDIVLRTCYRNSRPILLTAHAIGFGIYRRPTQAKPNAPLGLVQMFDQTGLWHDVGYSTTEGSLEGGKRVVLRRDPSASPRFLEDHSLIDDLVQFHVFDNEADQARWIVAEIEKNLSQDGLRHDDIIVINPDPITTRRKAGMIRARMLKREIACHFAGVDTDRDTFFATRPSITLSGVHRAKGNEAAMVYVVNADAGLTGTYNAAGVRNRLFAAITRSKAWVRVAGVGSAMEELKREYERLKQNDFELRFRYPTADERAKIRTVHRDLSPQQQERHRQRNTQLKELLRDIQRGECSVEDIDPELRGQLTSILVESSDSANDAHTD